MNVSRNILKRIKLGLCLTLYIRINSKWLRNLNAKMETVQILERNTGKFLLPLRITKDFLTIQ